MVGNTVKFLGNPETLFYLLSNKCSPNRLYWCPIDSLRKELWGTDDDDISDYYVIHEGLNGFECWFHTDSPPFGFYKYLATKFPDLRIYAESGFITQISCLHSRFVADFDESGKRRFQQMEWEEEYIEYYEEVPRDEELYYNVYEMLEKEEWEQCEGEMAFWTDSEPMRSIYSGEWISYDAWICSILCEEEEYEYYLLEMDYEECQAEIAFWTDPKPMHSIYFHWPETNHPGQKKYQGFLYFQGQYATKQWISYDAYLISIYAEEENYELSLLEEDFPTEEELIEDEIRMNHMDFDEWREFTSRLGKYCQGS